MVGAFAWETVVFGNCPGIVSMFNRAAIGPRGNTRGPMATRLNDKSASHSGNRRIRTFRNAALVSQVATPNGRDNSISTRM